MHTGEPLVPETSSAEVEIITENQKRYKTPGTDQIPAEFIKQDVVYYVLRSTNINFVSKRKNWHSSGISLILARVIKLTVVSKEGISLPPTTYKILSNILVSGLTPYVDEIIGDQKCGFRSNRSTPDQILCIRQVLAKKSEYNGEIHKLFVDSEKD
jgi:hypothetical protein